jgi:hypothetical protein
MSSLTDPCPRTASAGTPDLIGGVVVLWGRVELHATGMRAEHARVVALELPLSRGRKRRNLVEVAKGLGVPAVRHRELVAAAAEHGSLTAIRDRVASAGVLRSAGRLCP